MTSRADEVLAALVDLAHQQGVPDWRPIDRTTAIDGLGLTSLAAVEIAAVLNQRFGSTLAPTFFYEARTFGAVVDAVLGRTATVPVVPEGSRNHDAIAVIGLACRFPGAADADDYWSLLNEGREAIVPIPAERFIVPAGVPDRAGMLDEVAGFDPERFRLSVAEACGMDPQQRLLLELAWECGLDAGTSLDQLAGTRTGVFVGMSGCDWRELMQGRPVDARLGTNCSPAVAAGRIAYTWDLRGPAITVDTACSASLVAVHQAVVALQRSECDLALAGGVSLILTATIQQAFHQAGMLAPDGRCKSFDANANGYGRGEGGGLVLLKPLASAQRDGDPVLAVIRGSAMNQDGRSNGLTAPSMEAQVAVIRQALASAKWTPAEVDAIECHGTGTRLGDPIELGALAQVFAGDRTRSLAVTSVKTAIGHLEAAAGIAGFIKGVLQVGRHRLLPHRNFTQANPLLRSGGLHFTIPTVAEPWPQADAASPRLGVSSFGFSGTNAHVLLEGPPVPLARVHRPAPGYQRRHCWLPLVSSVEPSAEPSAERAASTPPVRLHQTVWQRVRLTAGRGASKVGLPGSAGVSPAEKAASAGCHQPTFESAWTAGRPPARVVQLPDGLDAAAAQAAILDLMETTGSLVVHTHGVLDLPGGGSGHLAALAGLAMASQGRIRLVDVHGLVDPDLVARALAADAPVLAIASGGAWAPHWGLDVSGTAGFQPAGGALAPQSLPVINAAAPTPLSGTWLVLGGSGGIGAALAGHLVQRGVTHLIVHGRSQAAATAVVDDLRQRFPECHFSTVVGDLAAPPVWVLPHLDGLVHAAGSLDLRAGTAKDRAARQEVLAPKLAGFESFLDRLPTLPDQALFIGSLAAWRGGLGGLDYAAANAALSGVAARLRRRGVAASCVACGIWREVGLAPRLFGALPADLQAQALGTAESLTAIDRILMSPGGDWVLERLAAPASHQNEPQTQPTILAKTESPSVSCEDLAATIGNLAAQVLERTEPVMPDHNLLELGLDSILALDLARRIHASTGLTISPAMILEHHSVANLAAVLTPAQEPAPASVPVPVSTGPVPASAASRQFWLLDRLGRGAAYQVGGLVVLEEPVEIPALWAAVESLIHRHQALRTCLVGVLEPMLDLRDWLEPRRDEAAVADVSEAQARAQALAGAGFDLAQGPLLAVGIYRLASGGAVLALIAHHAAVDGWSLGILLRELGEDYRQRRSGRIPVLPAVAMQAGDLAAAEARRDDTASLEFWKERFAHAAAPRRSATDGAPARHRRWPLPQGITAAAAALGLPPAMLVAAVFTAVTARWLGQRRLTIGLVHANRNDPTPQAAVAMQLTVLPLTLPATGTWAAAATACQAALRAAEPHADAAWTALAQAAEGQSLTQVLFSWNVNLGQRRPDFGQAARIIDWDASQAQGLIGLTVEGEGQDLIAHWDADASALDEADLERCHAGLLSGLAAVQADPQAGIAATWQRAAPALPLAPRAQATATVLARFVAKVAEDPTALVVIDGARTWTRQELLTRAQAWARHLGARRGQRVALVAGRSAERLAALLGIWLSAATAVLLDPAHGDERLAGILAQAEVAAVLDDNVLAQGPQGSGTLPSPATLDDAAYIIFTSGSTGTPKGVIIDHRSLVGHLEQWNTALGLGASDRLLHVSGVGFDAHLEEILAPLLIGGVCVVASQALPEPRDLARLCREHAVTVLSPVVSIGQAWSEDPAALPIPPSVRIFALGSEALGGPVLARLARPGLELLNLYGPTECTITPTVHRCQAADFQAACVPIGRPLPDRCAFVADDFGLPLPAGCSGELRLGGSSLAHGYWRDPRRTAVVFLPAPGGGRQYRTGDQVRQDADGVLHFLGRVDRQVKVNGVRIELAEVEAALASHPAIRRAAADLREGRIVAWVQWDQDPATDLAGHLGKRLPAAAIPGVIVPVSRWPLNANGKLDRQALMAEMPDSPTGEPPLPGLESDLAALWSELLPGTRTVDRSSDFIALGGHSLAAMRLSIRLRERLAVEVSPARLLAVTGLTAQAELLAALLVQAAPSVEATESFVL